MATKSVAEKLLIKPNTSVWLSHAAHLARIEPLPEGVRAVDELGQATVALVVAESAAAVRAILTAHADQLATPSIFWVAYPKANKADINRDTLWPILTEYGMRPISQVAIDEVWSALRFRPFKPGEAPFTGGQ
jgi:hypothetical protein